MTVKVVTDSTSDIPVQVAQELGITVVPLYIHFGNEVHRDGVDISPVEFYDRLVREPQLPKTSAPSSGTFTETYNNLATETDEVISIHISSKLSATYNSALVGKEGMEASCRVEIVDSFSASMGLGLLVIAAAKAALAGAGLDQIMAMMAEDIPNTHYFGLVDTLEYLHKGGRIGKAVALLGSVLNFKPLIEVRDGEVYPLERVRGQAKALARLCEQARKYPRIKELAIAHTTTPEDLEELSARLATSFPKDRIYRSQCGATIGAYVGPGALTMGLIEEKASPRLNGSG